MKTKISVMIFIILLMIVFTACSSNQKNATEMQDKYAKNDKGEPTRSFTSAELQAAEKALQNGVKIDDQQNDFFKIPPGTVQPDGRPDNPNPYPLPWIDFQSVSFGADENYLYVKFQFWGKFPKKGIIYDGDMIWSTGAKIDEMYFVNPEGKNDSAEFCSDVMFVRDDEHGNRVLADESLVGHLTMISPQGHDEKMETIYKTRTGAGMVAGGAGYDYVLSAIPLRIFGIKLGDEIIISFATETGSSKYHHEAIDFILDNPEHTTKGGAKLKYKLGSNSYENLGIPDYLKGNPK